MVIKKLTIKRFESEDAEIHKPVPPTEFINCTSEDVERYFLPEIPEGFYLAAVSEVEVFCEEVRLPAQGI